MKTKTLNILFINFWFTRMIMILFVFVNFNFAQFEEYKPISGPYGFRVNNITITDDDKIFLSTSWEGIFYSNDNGNSWENIGIKNEDVHDVCIDSKGRIYALINYYWFNDKQRPGILSSDDGGKLWNWNFTGITDPNVYSIVIDKNDRVYCGTKSGGVFALVDSTQSWKPIGLENKFIRTMSIDENNYLYAALDGDGIYRKKGENSDWEKLGTLVFEKCTDILFGRNEEIFLALGGYGPSGGMGIHKSINGGETWSAINSGIDDLFIRAICEDGSGNLFAGGTNGRVFKSINRGMSWEICSIGLTCMDVTSLQSNSNNKIFMGTLGSGIFGLSQNENLWQYYGPNILLGSKFTHDNNIFYCATSAGVYKSEDEGLSWAGISSGISNYEISGIVVTNNGTLIASTYGGGLFRSINSGIYWERVHDINYSAAIRFLKKSEKSNSLFIGINGKDHGVYKSIDDGLSWLKIASWDQPQTLLIRENGDIIVGTEHLFYTENEGESWEKIMEGNPFILGLAIDSSNGILAGTWTGTLSRTKDLGNTWDTLDFSPNSIFSLNTLPDGKIIASTFELENYISHDNGMSWDIMTESLFKNARIFEYHETESKIIFSTEKGLFYKNKQFVGIDKLSNLVPQNIILNNAFPNPFNPITKITFSLQNDTDLSIKIFNSQGKEIVTLLEAKVNAGIHSVDFDGSNCASGVYFYRLITPFAEITKKIILMK